MTKIDEELKAFLQSADPAGSVDDLRTMAVQERLFQALGRVPQDKRPVARTPFAFLRAPAALAARSAMAGLAVLLLGLFVGRTMNALPMRTTQQMAARQAMVQTIAARAVQKQKTEERFSLMAMTEPWQGWIEEGE